MVAVAEQVETKHASARPNRSTRKRQTQAKQPIRNSAVRVIAGPFAESVIRIWGADRIGEYLGASDARRHLWHACLASEHPQFQAKSVVSCQRLYRRFNGARGKDLVAQGFGCRPLGLLSALGRLGAAARSPEVYRALVRALDRGGPGAKVLMHSPQLPDSLIHALAILPPALNTKRLISLLSTGKIEAGDLAAFAWTATRIGQVQGPEVFRSLMSAKKPIDALVEVLVSAEFPPPPFPGTKQLHPVTSRAHLQRIGEEFNNCLRHRYWASRAILKVINGARYFYEWRGDQPGLLSFVRLQNVGWFLDEVEGPNDIPVSESTRQEIIRGFSGAADLCPFQADKFYGWNQDSAFVESVIGCLS